MKKRSLRKTNTKPPHRIRYGIIIALVLLFVLIRIEYLHGRKPLDSQPHHPNTAQPPFGTGADSPHTGTAAFSDGNAVDSSGQTAPTNSDDPLWYLILVNRQNPVPDGYTVNLTELEGGEQVDERIYEPLMEMLEAAREANWGQLPTVVSGYRTPEKQQRIYEDKIAAYRRKGYSRQDAAEMAGLYAALPGCSEHQLGLAVDINGATYDVYLWLQAHSYEYGFIFRYPGDKTELTGIAEEVWHYRYVGVEAATEIWEQGICLEEYVQNSACTPFPTG